jgi:hypothetical protein
MMFGFNFKKKKAPSWSSLNKKTKEKITRKI